MPFTSISIVRKNSCYPTSPPSHWTALKPWLGDPAEVKPQPCRGSWPICRSYRRYNPRTFWSRWVEMNPKMTSYCILKGFDEWPIFGNQWAWPKSTQVDQHGICIYPARSRWTRLEGRRVRQPETHYSDYSDYDLRPSGQQSVYQSANLKMAIQNGGFTMIYHDFPMKNGGSFHSYLEIWDQSLAKFGTSPCSDPRCRLQEAKSGPGTGPGRSDRSPDNGDVGVVYVGFPQENLGKHRENMGKHREKWDLMG